jgi:ribonuclease VapC
MVIDTSALVTVLIDEPDRPAFAAAIERDPTRLISAVSVLEASLVLESRFGADAVDDLDLLLAKIGARIVSFTADDLAGARAAYQRFGKGRHPAGLNFGDCFAYALASSTGEPLLFKGHDFAQTDITPVAPSGGAQPRP